jgi:hypothetical protein
MVLILDSDILYKQIQELKNKQYIYIKNNNGKHS